MTEGKGMQARTLDLEKRSAQALKNYLQQRPNDFDDHLFLNTARPARYGASGAL